MRLLQSQVDNACARLETLVKPKNIDLYTCLKGECLDATILCSNDCTSDEGCGVTQYKDKNETNPKIGKRRAVDYIKVCPEKSLRPGTTAMHELGHGCGCMHRRIPWRPPTNDYYDSGDCGMLPYACNGGFREFI